MKKKIQMPVWILKGHDYVPESLLAKNGLVKQQATWWELVPVSLRATEERVRKSTGATDPRWLEKHLHTYGCPIAVPLAEVYLRCYSKIHPNGFCASHRRWADKPRPSAGVET